MFIKGALSVGIIQKITNAILSKARKSEETLDALVDLLLFFSEFEAALESFSDPGFLAKIMEFISLKGTLEKEELMEKTMKLIGNVCVSEESQIQLVKLRGIEKLVEAARKSPKMSRSFIFFISSAMKHPTVVNPFKDQGISVENLSEICDYVDLDEDMRESIASWSIWSLKPTSATNSRKISEPQEPQKSKNSSA